MLCLQLKIKVELIVVQSNWKLLHLQIVFYRHFQTNKKQYITTELDVDWFAAIRKRWTPYNEAFFCHILSASQELYFDCSACEKLVSQIAFINILLTNLPSFAKHHKKCYIYSVFIKGKLLNLNNSRPLIYLKLISQNHKALLLYYHFIW